MKTHVDVEPTDVELADVEGISEEQVLEARSEKQVVKARSEELVEGYVKDLVEQGSSEEQLNNVLSRSTITFKDDGIESAYDTQYGGESIENVATNDNVNVLVDKENEIIEHDVQVHLFDMTKNVEFENIDITSQVLTESLNHNTTVKIVVERNTNPYLPTRVFKRLYICLGPLKKVLRFAEEEGRAYSDLLFNNTCEVFNGKIIGAVNNVATSGSASSQAESSVGQDGSDVDVVQGDQLVGNLVQVLVNLRTRLQLYSKTLKNSFTGRGDIVTFSRDDVKSFKGRHQNLSQQRQSNRLRRSPKKIHGLITSQITSDNGNGYSLNDKNEAKTKKTEHGNGMSVKSQSRRHVHLK
ncbi:hypothetical protein Tco_0463144 [Tanacetum coccineum]